MGIVKNRGPIFKLQNPEVVWLISTQLTVEKCTPILTFALLLIKKVIH
jgi:hypothetical protein